jgi:hypothetical protein
LVHVVVKVRSADRHLALPARAGGRQIDGLIHGAFTAGGWFTASAGYSTHCGTT